MADPRPSGWIGSILQDRWRIDSKIARGGVATVFKASERGGPKVAIKIMHPEFARNLDARGRFLREGYVANKVGHPMVVKVLADAITPDGSAFLVMELLEDGELLEDRRERLGGKLMPDEVARIGDQVLDVLSAAHDQGIVHRDIKPENIFLLNDGTLKVLDFGIAHIKEAAMKAEPTATGLLLGTPDFMSPEQAMGMRGTIDPQTDVYAIGATMFTLLSGEAVHTDQHLGALLHSTSTKQARSLATTQARDVIPHSLIAVVDKACMLVKSQRWASARAMQEALHKAMPMALKPALSQSPDVPQSKTRPLVSIDALTRSGANPNIRSSGKAPLPSATTPRDGVKAVAAKAPRQPTDGGGSPPSDRTVVRPPSSSQSIPPPGSEGVATPREASSPWLAEFTNGDMEGPTVATNELPPQVSTRRLPSIAPDMTGTQALPQSLRPAPTPRGQSFPPPPQQQYGSMPPPPQQQYGSMPPPPQQQYGSMPPPAHGSNPYPIYVPPPPTSPRGQAWKQEPPTGPAAPGSVPSRRSLAPAPIPMASPLAPPAPAPTARRKPKKSSSIFVAEVILAALVVVTLSIAVYLLTKH